MLALFASIAIAQEKKPILEGYPDLKYMQSNSFKCPRMGMDCLWTSSAKADGEVILKKISDQIL